MASFGLVCPFSRHEPTRKGSMPPFSGRSRGGLGREREKRGAQGHGSVREGGGKRVPDTHFAIGGGYVSPLRGCLGHESWDPVWELQPLAFMAGRFV